MTTDYQDAGRRLLQGVWCTSEEGALFLKRKCDFDVPPAAISEALAVIAKQADVLIVVPLGDLDHKVPEIRGTLWLDDVLFRALAGSGWSFRRGALLAIPRCAVAPEIRMQELVSMGGEFQQGGKAVVELLDPVKRGRDGFPSVYLGNEAVGRLELPLPCIVLRSPDDPGCLGLPWGPEGVLVKKVRTSVIAQDIKRAELGDVFAYTDIDELDAWFQLMIVPCEVKLLSEIREICPGIPPHEQQEILQRVYERIKKVPNFMSIISPDEYAVTVACDTAHDWIRGERG